MFKSKSLVALSLILSMLLSTSAPVFASLEVSDETNLAVPYEIIDVTHQELDGNIVYFGAQELAFEESEKVYAFPIVRSGDVSEEASVVLRTLDFAALYNRDYSIIGDTIEIVEYDKTLIELAMTGEEPIMEDDVLNTLEDGSQQIAEILEENIDVLTDDVYDAEEADTPAETSDESDENKEYFAVVPEVENEETSGKSKLALEKEAQTGNPTREVQKTEVYNELGGIVRDVVLDNWYDGVNYSSETVLTFAPGEDVKYIHIRIMDDSISEGDEYFTLLMTEAYGAELSETTSANVIITDDEPVMLSKITFTSDTFKSKDGMVTVTVKRTGSEYSPATCIIESDDGSAIADMHYESVYGEIVFAPYETEKIVEIPVAGKGNFTLKLSDFTGSEAGALCQTTVKIDEEAGIALFAASGGLEFNITVKDKTYTVRYKSGDIVGEIYDTNYDPELLVGKYYFSAPDSQGGIFNYSKNNGTGTMPSNEGNYNSFYSGPSTAGNFATGNGQLEYYHSLTTRTGSMYTYNNINADTKIEGPYYQYLIPHWEQDRNFGNVFVDDSQESSMEVYNGPYVSNGTGLIGEGIRTGEFTTETSMDSAVQIKDALNSLCVKIAAVDSYTGRTPKIRTKFYGVAAFYKKYRISVTYPTDKQFITGVNAETGEAITTGYIPVQVNVNCGAQILGNRENMDIFINDDEKKSNLVFSVSDNRVNGVNGKFGKITGYTIRIGSSAAYTTKNYPADYFSFLDSMVSANKSTVAIAFTSTAVESVKNKVNSNLDTIPVDKYFAAWIESVQNEKISEDKIIGVVSDGGKAYHQELKFTPIVEYYDVDVTVVKPYTEGTDMDVVLGGFKWQELSLGTHSFHAGDALDLTGEPYDVSYKAEGYEVSVNDGDFNTIRDTKTLVLLPGNKYTIRPVISAVNNCVIITQSAEAAEWLSISSAVFTAEELAPYPEFAGKTILKLHPEKATVLEQMTPEVGKIYSVDIVWKNNPSSSTYTYFPYITDKMTDNAYITNKYYFKARSMPGDNVMHIDTYMVNTADVGLYTLQGSVKTSYKPILSNGLEFSKEGAEGYSVIIGSGETEIEKTVNGVTEMMTIVNTVNDITDADGLFELDAIQGFNGAYVNLLVTNGTNTEDIINIKLPAKGTDGKEITASAGETCLLYSPNLPYISEGGISYYYDKSTNNDQIDLRENSIRVFDDNLTLRAVVNSNGRKIQKAVFQIRTTTGIVSSYDAYPEMTGSNVYSCKIDTLPEKAYNGDRVSVYLVDEETLDGTDESAAIVYPKVDTGIVFYVENAVIAPKEYSFEELATVNVPLLGKTKTSSNSGLLNFEKTKWADGKGISFAINITGTYNGVPAKTTEEKLEGYEKFKNGIANAKAMNEQLQQTENELNTTRQTLTNVLRQMEADEENMELYTPDKTSLQGQIAEYEELLKTHSKQAKDAQTVFNKDYGSVSAILSLCLDYILNPETQEYKFFRVAIGIGTTLTGTGTEYSLIGSVPTFINFSGTFQFNVTFAGTKEGMLSSTDFESYTGNIDSIMTGMGFDVLVEMVTKGKLQAGAGMNGVLSVRGFVELALQSEASGTRVGVVFTGGGGVGFDLLIGSIDLTIAKFVASSGSLGNRNQVTFFNDIFEVTPATMSLRSAVGDSAVSSKDGTSTTEYDAGTDDMSTFGMKMLRGMPEAVNMQTLLNNAADRTRPQILDLGNGRKFIVFIGNRGTDSTLPANDMCLFYSVCDENGNWTEPVPVADDGTFDSMPKIILGTNKKNVGIVWVDSARELTEEDTLKEKLNTFGISAAVYNLEHSEMSDEINFAADEYFNLAPQVSMVDDKIYVSYMARDIESVTKDEDILDVSGLYSTMVTVGYDMTAQEIIPKRFVEIKHPAIIDPLTMDYNTLTSRIGDNTYTLATYTVDTDSDITTSFDRELYLSIRDVTNDKAYYPIKISSDATVSSPKLTKLGDEIFLSWIQNSREIQLLDVSDIVSALFMNDDIGTIYADSDEEDAVWYKKTAEELGMYTEESFIPDDESDYDGLLIYDDSIYDDLYNGIFRTVGTSFNEDEKASLAIEEYKLVTNGNDIYIFFTKMNEDPHKTGMELYGIRYKRHIAENADNLNTDDTWGFTDAVAITDYDAVIDEFDMFMTEDNKISLVSNFYKQSINDAGVLEFSPNKLVEIDFEPMGSANIKYDDIDVKGTLVPGSTVSIEFDVENRGLYTLKDYDLQVVAEQNGIEEVIFEETVKTHLDTNESESYKIAWTVPENVDDTTIKVTVAEASGVVQARPQTVESILSGAPKVRMSSLKFDLADDGRLMVSTTAENIGNTASAETDLNICYENDTVIATTKLKALEPGETVDITVPVELRNAYFNTLGVMVVKAEADFGDDNVITASGDYIPLKPVVAEINGGEESFDLKVGKTSTLTCVAAPWDSLAGQVIYSSADDNVATVDGNGVVAGVGVGTTQITAYYIESGISDVINVNVKPADSSGGTSGSFLPNIFIPTQPEKNKDGSVTKTTIDKKTGAVTEVTTYPDGDVVTVKTEIDGTVTAEVKANSEKTVVLPIEPTENMIVVSFTDEDGRTTYTDEFTESKEGIAVTAVGNVKISIIQRERTQYTDVHNNNHWAAKYIDFVSALGIMNGIGEGKFAPDAPLTRAMLVTMLYRAEGEPEVHAANGFADVDENAWYAKAVLWAKQNGIVNGVTENTFAPDSDVTREQIAAIMHRYAVYKGDDTASEVNTNILSYDDFASISDYAIAPMQWAIGTGLIQGKTESTLNPLDNATRAEFATIFYRFVKANK